MARSRWGRLLGWSPTAVFSLHPHRADSRQGARALVTLRRVLVPIVGAPLSWPLLILLISQRPHQLIPSHCGGGFHYVNAGEDPDVQSVHRVHRLTSRVSPAICRGHAKPLFPKRALWREGTNAHLPLGPWQSFIWPPSRSFHHFRGVPLRMGACPDFACRSKADISLGPQLCTGLGLQS